MTRQNCKNCGEPYEFDLLVTPGREERHCVACQRKIYTHTGQIVLSPTRSSYHRSEPKVSIAPGVSLVHESAISMTMNAKYPHLAQRHDQGDKSGWKSVEKSEAPHLKPAYHHEDRGKSNQEDKVPAKGASQGCVSSCPCIWRCILLLLALSNGGAMLVALLIFILGLIYLVDYELLSSNARLVLYAFSFGLVLVFSTTTILCLVARQFFKKG